MAASYRLDIASGASSYCTGWALPSFLRCRKLDNAQVLCGYCNCIIKG